MSENTTLVVPEDILPQGEERKPWHRQPNEPTMWYERFLRWYLPLGHTRTLLSAYNEYRRQVQGKTTRINTLGGSWYDNAVAWEWQQRAALFDDTHRRSFQEAIEQEADQINTMLLRGNVMLWSKAVDALATKDLSGEPVNPLINAMKTAQRNIAQLLPSDTTQHVQITHKLPAILQNLILDLLSDT